MGQGSFFVTVPAALSFLAVGAAAVRAADVTPVRAADVTPAASPTPAAATPHAGETPASSASSLDRIWWNRSTFVTTLQLTEQQRHKMDAFLLRALESQRAAQAQFEAKRAAFEAAVTKGDWEAARKAAADARGGLANVWEIQSGLTIDVLSLLSAQQRQDFISKYPQLLRRPWMLTMGGRGARVRGPGPRVNN